MTLGNPGTTEQDVGWLGGAKAALGAATPVQFSPSTAKAWPDTNNSLPDDVRPACSDELQLVTVITANFNGSRYLGEAIESVLQQSHRDIEYIIVDDGSTDNSKEIIDYWCERDSRLRAIYLPENAGVAHARNIGIQQSTGEFLAFLDADDLWHPDKLAKQLALFESHPEAGIVVTASTLIGADGQPLKPTKRKRVAKQGKVSLYDYIAGHFPVSINAMTKRECIARRGLFNPDYTIGEDYELWMRITRDYEYYYVDEPMHWYRVHENNATRDKLVNRESKIRILEDCVYRQPQLLEELGEEFRVVLQRKYNSLGKAYFFRGRLGEARKCFIKALNMEASGLQQTKAKLWCLFLMMKGL